MKRYVYDAAGETLLRVEKGTPVCGEDFCDRCGDCLACHAWECTNGKGCWWVVYEDASGVKP